MATGRGAFWPTATGGLVEGMSVWFTLELTVHMAQRARRTPAVLCSSGLHAQAWRGQHHVVPTMCSVTLKHYHRQTAQDFDLSVIAEFGRSTCKLLLDQAVMTQQSVGHT